MKYSARDSTCKQNFHDDSEDKWKVMKHWSFSERRDLKPFRSG
jgi:hypothetical protein